MMAWYSLLPPTLSYIESSVVHIFIFLGFVTIFPWAALLIFDICLYTGRMLTFELPVVGGRARGKQRPRAPSLNERPGGQPRVLVGLSANTSSGGGGDNGREEKGLEGVTRRVVAQVEVDGGVRGGN
ncbi:hypothetical protein CBS63078_5409 [Aspergillus niger]|uniref:uncharacterized protein n=1 Tax=Aspergillus lacticoffeatus (strain CBS 101883) TaxID=1450533 RepID=UPI0001F2732C|nr:hypothetical protein ANI_1_1034024 [Aspergillus niger CBS 513.88]XP_025461190.1 uncharacterized protein BO96DRAFT_407765 [Aspergillus niger CBS 101883]KAI2819657.1 hypothetical protein CBS115989_4265 [Aspergillus niger]KAI2827707.1 hypothetical protein CBS133816_6146 [Aspergillus niger]KAI2836383.1 hypothetical protein CBS11350_9391 [Aspergillus niger]KAI2855393.1 hypothetical protein CBS11232_4428 [Aspergillus niger]KAI2866740.1 hypothetical protein CBS12448_1036 [Aspergillus niger]|eukprot:XP_003188584.1 hypothetical protein ANI_1_1034024 [Aspergillus niger CBS 513.88]